MNATPMIKKTIVCACFACLLPVVSAHAQGHSALLGVWRSTSALGEVELVFQSGSRLVFDGEAADYTLGPNVIRVQEDGGTIDYPYVFSGKTLIISFPEGYQLAFTKVGGIREAPKPAKTDNAPPNNSRLASEISGIWWGYSGSTERKIGLCPGGAYQDYTESGYSGSASDALGNETLAWGTAGQSGGRGTWRIQGDFQQGTIFVRYADGRETRIRYEQCGETGCLLFNGNKLCRSGRCE